MATPIPPSSGAPKPTLEDEPDAKRVRVEEEAVQDDVLLSEEDWLEKHSGACSVFVEVPTKEGTDMKGQKVQVDVDSLAEAVSAIKAKVAAAVGVPANKQKLANPGGNIMRDVDSLAYYNVPPGATLSMALKERGGRKK
ncbi:hypothetical protein CYMTET_52568 [Cymbomonas tetramitiformis]|uniref:Ubiquitin-like domain-containing protein n=1 Tax=Cymbomonas tetramitiformis TaxID=36881 RepID=A0AAE0EQY2_9CHLO|nr:hypothetical protein CYMTET_52568 [Cymbomonas tetramitiformis]